MNGPQIAIVTFVILSPLAVWFCMWISRKQIANELAQHFHGWFVFPDGTIREVYISKHWGSKRDGKYRECGAYFDPQINSFTGGPVVETADEALRQIEKHPVWKLSNFVFRDEHQAKLLAVARTAAKERNLMQDAHDAHDRLMKLSNELENKNAGSEEPAPGSS